MNYIYDIILNFTSNYFDFYEWKNEDILINFKKIPLFHVNSDVINDFIYYDIEVDKSFLNSIKGRSLVIVFIEGLKTSGNDAGKGIL